MPSRFSVLSEGSSSPTCAGSGICLTQTITFMARSLLPSDVRAAPQPASRRPRPATAGTSALADPAGRELVRLVGDGPQHRRRAPPAERATTRSSSSRPTAAVTPPASPTTPPGAASTSSSGSAATARSTRSPPASPAPTPPSAPCRAGRRTCSPARSACPTTPSRPSSCSPAASTPGALRPIGLGQVNGRFFCFHTGVGYDAAVVAAVEERASLKRWLGHPLFITAGLTTWARGYDRRHPHFRVVTADRVIDDGYFSIVLNTNPYTYLGNRPLDLSPRRDARPWAGGDHVPDDEGDGDPALARRRPARRRRASRRPTSTSRSTSTTSSSSTTPRSRTSSTATTSARSTASSSTTSPTPSASSSRKPRDHPSVWSHPSVGCAPVARLTLRWGRHSDGGRRA